MARTEEVTLTVMCMLYQNNKVLLQNRTSDKYHGMAFPGGHVEKGESFVQAVIREMKEETGLTVFDPQLCGIKQFQTKQQQRYMVFLYKSNHFTGDLVSSPEGEMIWFERDQLPLEETVIDLRQVMQIMDNPQNSELYYTNDNSLQGYATTIY